MNLLWVKGSSWKGLHNQGEFCWLLFSFCCVLHIFVVVLLDVSVLIDALASLTISVYHYSLPNAFIFLELFFSAVCSCPPPSSSGLGRLAFLTYYPLFSCSHSQFSAPTHTVLFISSSLLSHSYLLQKESFPSPELPTSPQFSHPMLFLPFQFLLHIQLLLSCLFLALIYPCT